MKIWVDADACPTVIKDILFKAAERTKIHTTLVANHHLRIPPSSVIHFMQVGSGFDIADDEIVKRVEKNDLVITADIPLADEVISKSGIALSPRGELFTKENIKSVRPGFGLHPKYLKDILGKKADKNLNIGDRIKLI